MSAHQPFGILSPFDQPERSSLTSHVLLLSLRPIYSTPPTYALWASAGKLGLWILWHFCSPGFTQGYKGATPLGSLFAFCKKYIRGFLLLCVFTPSPRNVGATVHKCVR